MSRNDGLGGGVQISRPSVIAEALPRVEYVIFASATKRGKIGKAATPFIEIRNDGPDLCLLKHELGNEDRVRIARPAPWQIAAVAAIPI